MKSISLVATHNGIFHTDDVFAVAILKLMYPSIRFIRTRDPVQYSRADLCVDVGRMYNPAKGLFDHHQESFRLKRNGILYASAGLIWKHFGYTLAKNKIVFEYIDKKLLQPIDALDNGISLYNEPIVQPYTLQKIIDLFNPSWTQEKENYDREFNDAVSFAMEVLRREIAKAKQIPRAQAIVQKAIKEAYLHRKKYIVLPSPAPPWKSIVAKNQHILFVVYRQGKESYCVHAVAVSMEGFENRKNLPASWADRVDADLARISGVRDAYFCHKNLFIACAKSKEGAIMLAEKAVLA